VGGLRWSGRAGEELERRKLLGVVESEEQKKKKEKFFSTKNWLRIFDFFFFFSPFSSVASPTAL